MLTPAYGLKTPEGIETTACSSHSSRSIFRSALWALLDPNNTPSGTITPARPPMSSRLMIRLTNRSSVLVVLRASSSWMSPLSMLPLNGGLARATVYLSLIHI